MTSAEITNILRQFNEWRRGDYAPSEQPAPPDPCEIGEAIDAAVEMIERSIKLEQALKAMTKVYKSVPYVQWPAEMHFANEVLEKSK
jgi:hypothetical protein